MDARAILQPMLALVALTFGVLLMIPYRRFRAGFRGEVNFDSFRYGEAPEVPPWVRLPNRNYMSLLELPVLFYTLCLVHLLLGRLAPLTLGLAWTYVGLRALHSAVHLSYNDVPHRLAVFAVSNAVLALMWILLAVDLA